MIRNRYNHLTPKTPKGKKDTLKVTSPQSIHYKQKAKGQFIQNMAKRLSKIEKKMHQDKHAKIYNERYSKPQQKHCLGTLSKNITVWGGGRGLHRFYVAPFEFDYTRSHNVYVLKIGASTSKVMCVNAYVLKLYAKLLYVYVRFVMFKI